MVFSSLKPRSLRFPLGKFRPLTLHGNDSRDHWLRVGGEGLSRSALRVPPLHYGPPLLPFEAHTPLCKKRSTVYSHGFLCRWCSEWIVCLLL